MDITELGTGFQSYSAEELEGAQLPKKDCPVVIMVVPVAVAVAHDSAWGEWVRDTMLLKRGFDLDKSYSSETVGIGDKMFYRYMQMKEVQNG